MDLSICILTHNQPTLLPICVKACMAEVERAQITAEIIVIDNASAGAYPERLLGRSPMLRILRTEENLSFSSANNLAIRSSTGRHVLILNDDAILLEGSLALMLQEVESNAATAAVGPKLLESDGSVQQNFTNRRFPHFLSCLTPIFAFGRSLERHSWASRFFGLNRDLERTAAAEHLAGACLLARRQALDDIGLFDEEFYYWFEDTDLCYRLRKAGWKIVYVAEARVIHHRSATIGKIAEAQRALMFLRSQKRYLRKHWSMPKYAFLGLAAIVTLLLDLPLLVLKRWLGTASQSEWSAWRRNYLPILRFFLLEWR